MGLENSINLSTTCLQEEVNLSWVSDLIKKFVYSHIKYDIHQWLLQSSLVKDWSVSCQMKTLSSYAYGISVFQKHLCTSREGKIVVAILVF